MYNTTNITNATNMYLVTVEVNNYSNGLFAPLLLFTLFVILLFSMKAYDTKAALLATSFIIAILSVLLYFLQLCGIQTLIICVILLIIFMFSFIFAQ